MKTKIHLFLPIIFTLFSFASLIAGQKEAWYNPYTGITIYAEYYNNGIHVKGLHQINQVTWFKRKGNSTFKDVKGNTIQLKKDILIYKARNKKAKLTFIPLAEWQNHPKSPQKTYQSNNFSSINDDRNNNGLIKGPDDKEMKIKSVHTTDHQSSLNDISATKLEGTWAVQNLDKKVYIVETRTGIKARFTDNLKWYEYDKIPNSDTYINKANEKYILDNNTLIWYSKDNQNTFVMYKKSNDLIE